MRRHSPKWEWSGFPFSSQIREKFEFGNGKNGTIQKSILMRADHKWRASSVSSPYCLHCKTPSREKFVIRCRYTSRSHPITGKSLSTVAVLGKMDVRSPQKLLKAGNRSPCSVHDAESDGVAVTEPRGCIALVSPLESLRRAATSCAILCTSTVTFTSVGGSVRIQQILELFHVHLDQLRWADRRHCVCFATRRRPLCDDLVNAICSLHEELRHSNRGLAVNR